LNQVNHQNKNNKESIIYAIPLQDSCLQIFVEVCSSPIKKFTHS
jgi:hypothetical protein